MSGQPAPTVITTPFASSALPGNINVVPVAPPVSPGLACYQNGFPAVTMQPISSGGVPPEGQDFNGVLFDLSGNIAANQAGQYFPYNSAIATAISGYKLGAILAMANGTGLWQNTVDGNSTNPDTANPATSGWVPLASIGITNLTGLAASNVTLTAVQAASSQIFLSGVLTNNINIVMPPWFKNWFIYNVTTGPFTITVKLAASPGCILPRGGTYIVGFATDVTYANCQRGTFTAVYAGGTTNPSTTACYTVANGIVTVTLPSVTVTSNQTIFELAGLPALLVPLGAAQGVSIQGEDSGAWVPGVYAQPLLDGSTPKIKFGLNGSLTGWTSSGTKRVFGDFTYDLYAGL